jgi:hypothetical protein
MFSSRVELTALIVSVQESSAALLPILLGGWSDSECACMATRQHCCVAHDSATTELAGPPQDVRHMRCAHAGTCMDRARSASLRICASRSSGWYLEACNQHDAHHDTHGVAAKDTPQRVSVF